MKKRFRVEITEVLSRIVDVEARNANEAKMMVENDYRESSIVLDSSDYVKTEFCVKDEK
jgi:uncharacterized membrane protein